MHIPDNYLSPSTCAAFGAVMLPVWRKAAGSVRKELTRKKMPLLGVCSAFSFLIMMFNVPVPGGTTAHAVGAALIAILLGPWSALISVTIALAIQALLFGDGGILALGVNCFNMAFVIPFTSYYIYRFVKGRSTGEKRDYAAAFAAGYISLNLAALCAALEFGIQPLLFKDAAGMPLYSPYSFKAAIPAMLIPHLLIAGFIEGAVTAGVLAYVKKVSPGIIKENHPVKMKPLYILLLIMAALCPVGLLATGTAWGEWSSEELKNLTGFIPKGMEKGLTFKALLPDYAASGIPPVLGYVLSAVIGAAVIFAAFRFITKKSKLN
jgi:cobalt/nickel transport system permease protein